MALSQPSHPALRIPQPLDMYAVNVKSFLQSYQSAPVSLSPDSTRWFRGGAASPSSTTGGTNQAAKGVLQFIPDAVAVGALIFAVSPVQEGSNDAEPSTESSDQHQHDHEQIQHRQEEEEGSAAKFRRTLARGALAHTGNEFHGGVIENQDENILPANSYYTSPLPGSHASPAPPGSKSASTTKLKNKPQLKPHLLLIKRSSSDSHPDEWEIPGGGVDLEDESILHATAREVREETGLTVVKVVDKVGADHHFVTQRRSLRVVKVNFLVEVLEVLDFVVGGEHDERSRDDHKEEGKKNTISEKGSVGTETHSLPNQIAKSLASMGINSNTADLFGGDDSTSPKPHHRSITTSGLTEYGGQSYIPDLSKVKVQLDPQEHQDHAWITEDQLHQYKMTTAAQLMLIEEGFARYNEILEEERGGRREM